jgi:hypothetical protein
VGTAEGEEAAMRVRAAAILTVGAFLTVGGTAAAAPVAAQCGQGYDGVDVILQADLACAGFGIGINDGTLDLNGHTLSGNGTSIGVSLSGATVRNGTVTGFGTGIQLEGDATVTSVVVVRNSGYGVFNDGRASNSVLLSRIAHNGAGGIFAGGQADVGVYEGNQVIANGGNGITVEDSTAMVLNNYVSYNRGTGISLLEDESPIFGPGYVIGGNQADYNTGFGIAACIVDRSNPPHINNCASGMRDAGGNSAVGNGQTHQCLNIFCASTPPATTISPATPMDHEAR